MELKYDVTNDGSITNVHFDGLDGYERVTTIKQAVSMLQVENPAVVFTANAKAGEYDSISDAEYERMLNAVERIALLWRYNEDEPANKSTQQRMNALMLLANAIEMISRQNVRLPDE